MKKNLISFAKDVELVIVLKTENMFSFNIPRSKYLVPYALSHVITNKFLPFGINNQLQGLDFHGGLLKLFFWIYSSV